MAAATEGDTVRIHYTGTLDDGTVFDSSDDREPLEFKVGSGQVISGFDAAVAGMEAGDHKTVTITAEDAYGPHRPDLMIPVPRSDLPEGIDPQVGQHLQLSTPDGQDFQVTVSSVGEEGLLLDANHPLAGRDLTFSIQLVSVA
ncbi:MAG: peptidylprolyl isomerase [Gemmatimonadetes bacterium]|nr:peptidylprolyl isomerase [Gemmatimonadota bacterium]